MYGYESDPAWVRVGDHDNSDPGDTDYHHIQTFKVKKIVVHRKYDERTTANDIALLKLEGRIDFSQYGGTVAPICLPTQADTYYGEKVIVAGWGLLNENGNAANKVEFRIFFLVANSHSSNSSSSSVSNSVTHSVSKR